MLIFFLKKTDKLIIYLSGSINTVLSLTFIYVCIFRWADGNLI